MTATAQRFCEERRGCEVTWERRSLQAFADFPLDELAREYDLIVMDHPHVGEVAVSGSLLPLDQHAPTDVLQTLRAQAVGNSHDSYSFDGHQWALAIDAACQVSAYHPNRIKEAPRTWDAVSALAQEGRVLWPLKPVDCICSFFTLAANRGTPCALGEEFIAISDGVAVLELMAEVSRHIPECCLSMNPIETLEALVTNESYAYSPLLFGYTNYSRRGFRADALAFTDIPSHAGGPQGSVLGGAGLAVSRYCRTPGVAVEYALWVASAEVQRSLYFEAGGQPANVVAWEDNQTNQASNDFFRSTRATMDSSWIRPRHTSFIEFQNKAGNIINEFLRAPGAPESVVRSVNDLYRKRNQGSPG